MSHRAMAAPRRGARRFWLAALVALLALGGRQAPAEERQAMRFSVTQRLATATVLGAADQEAALPMSITLQLQHPDELAALIAEQQRPGSSEYRQWLSAGEFAERFAPAADQYGALSDWLAGEGFTVSTWPNRLRIDFAGTVAQVEHAFQVHMNRYHHRGRDLLANADVPTIPAQFADLVQSARLNTFPLAEPLVRVMGANTVVDTMAPQDMYTAYDEAPALAAGIDGSGQTIAVVARSDFLASDVSSFQTQFQVPQRAAVKAFPGSNPGVGSPGWACAGIRNPATLQTCLTGEETEVDLDTEWAGAMAPGATVLVDISDMDVDLSLSDVVNHHPEAKIISISFGLCERLDASVTQTVAPLYAQAAAQGQSVLVATGDRGPDECDDGGAASVNALASDANVTAVGGTALDPGFDANGNASRYVGETAWGDQSGASGGGVSTLVAKPSYQSGPGVPAGGFRDLPDVALLASPRSSGYLIVIGGRLEIVGGTSVAAPSWAGIVALANDAAHADGLGLINVSLYDLARAQFAGGGSAVFHDVTSGDTTFNKVTGFGAGVGFDLATGWGSPDVELLTQAIAAAPTAAPTPVPTVLPCVGDCDSSGAVTIEDLLTAVNISLGIAPLASCPSLDCSGSGSVTIDCLVDAVNAALNGCGQ